MLIEELFRSCRNENVAAAALDSIGYATGERVRRRARLQGLSAGAFVAKTVTAFQVGGAERDLRAVVNAMDIADQPILAGLNAILGLEIAHSR